MFCNKCGSEISQQAIYCPKCGSEIKSDNVISRNEYLVEQYPPNSVAALVLGIVSFALSMMPLIGLVAGIIGAVMANSGLREYRANPNRYTNSGMLSAGKVFSIIGICLSSIFIFILIIYIVFVGYFTFAWWEIFQDL